VLNRDSTEPKIDGFTGNGPPPPSAPLTRTGALRSRPPRLPGQALHPIRLTTYQTGNILTAIQNTPNSADF